MNANVCRERLETSLSSNAGLIPDKSMFDKKEIRMKTGLFYKQNKFNLLREQSEGYSKLTAELTSSLAPPLTPLTSAAIEDRARPVWEKVISLIGYFDLDPNRALDIILDVLSVHLATHYTFFVALLGLSPWKGNYKTSTTTESTSDGMSDRYKDKTLDEVLKLAEGNGNVAEVREGEGETRQPRVMAQVLGFKFAYYQVGALARSYAPHKTLIQQPVPGCCGESSEEFVFDSGHPDSRGIYIFGRFVPSRA